MRQREWEEVAEKPYTKRLKVVGGYLYAIFDGPRLSTTVFVPDPKRQGA